MHVSVGNIWLSKRSQLQNPHIYIYNPMFTRWLNLWAELAKASEWKSSNRVTVTVYGTSLEMTKLFILRPRTIVHCLRQGDYYYDEIP